MANGTVEFGRQSSQSDMLFGLLAWAMTLRSGGSPYPKAPVFSAHVARWMMEDPVVSLGYAITLYPIIAAAWSVDVDQGVPDEQVNFAQDQYVKTRIFF